MTAKGTVVRGTAIAWVLLTASAVLAQDGNGSGETGNLASQRPVGDRHPDVTVALLVRLERLAMRQHTRILFVTAMACGLLFVRTVAAQQDRERLQAAEATRRAAEKRARAVERARMSADVDLQISTLEATLERVAFRGAQRDVIVQWAETRAFGTVNAVNQGRTRGRFLLILDDQIAEARDAFRLTPAQESRLRLAARGDMKRYFDDLDRAREKLRLVIFEADKRKPVISEIRRLRRADATGPFGEGSIYAKVLEKIRREQVVAAT